MQVSAVLLKSPGLSPPMVTSDTASAALPGLVTVTGCPAPVVFTVWLPKSRLVGLGLATPVATKPLPVSVMLCGLGTLVALSLTCRVALRGP